MSNYLINFISRDYELLRHSPFRSGILRPGRWAGLAPEPGSWDSVWPGPETGDWAELTHGGQEMESLPEPSDLVEDEWAAMKIRFKKEGLNWDKLSQEERILQVKSVISSVTGPAVNCYISSTVGSISLQIASLIVFWLCWVRHLGRVCKLVWFHVNYVWVEAQAIWGGDTETAEGLVQKTTSSSGTDFRLRIDPWKW